MKLTVSLVAALASVSASVSLAMLSSPAAAVSETAIATASPRLATASSAAPADSPASDTVASLTSGDAQLGTHHAQSSPTTVEYIELTTDDNRILIRADRPIESYNTYWDRSTLAYAITIPNARLAANLTLPDARTSEAILWVTAEANPDGSVTVYVMPAPQVSVRGVNEPSTEMLALELQPYGINNSEGVGVANTGNTGNAGNTGTSSFDWSSINNLPSVTNADVIVVIDPGHGGPDTGAVGIGGLREVSVVDPVSTRVTQLLLESGVDARLTRTGDYDLDLPPRVDFANRVQANLFVSIHANAISLSRPDVNGIETFYFQSGDLLAAAIQDSLLDATGSRDRGVKVAGFYVLRYTDMPSALVELGFVTGNEDAPRLGNPDYQETLARAVTRGILEYIERYCPGSYCEP